MDLDLTFPALPDGRYDAVIEAIDLKRYTTVLLCIRYRIPHKGRDFPVWEELAIDAPASSPSYARTAQGKGRIFEILSAFGEPPPPRIFAPDLEDTLVGREVHISHSQQAERDIRRPDSDRGPRQGPQSCSPANRMNARIRFGTHARAILVNGWSSIIPVRRKIPVVTDWVGFGTAHPSSDQI